MKKIVLKGKRIYLRPLRMSDAREITEQAKDRSVSRFTRIPHPYTIKDARKWLKRAESGWKEGTHYNFGIFLKDNRYIGSIGIHEVSPLNQKCEIGYYLGKSFRGKGYMTEAAMLILKFIFNEMKLHRIEVTIHPENIRSQKLIGRLGGKYEGYLREGVNLKGKFVDAKLYGILKKDIKN
jgi:RimJ/RimL family protein N-acetyltransferase